MTGIHVTPSSVLFCFVPRRRMTHVHMNSRSRLLSSLSSMLYTTRGTDHPPTFDQAKTSIGLFLLLQEDTIRERFKKKAALYPGLIDEIPLLLTIINEIYQQEHKKHLEADRMKTVNIPWKQQQQQLVTSSTKMFTITDIDTHEKEYIEVTSYRPHMQTIQKEEEHKE